MIKNINDNYHNECVKRMDQLEDFASSAPGPFRDLLSILRLMDIRLVELERKK